MSDPRRLLAGDATEFERLLLGAAGHERPSHSQHRRMRRALILAELGVFATSAKALASLAQHVVVVAVVASSLAGSDSPSAVMSSRLQNEGVTPTCASATSKEQAKEPVGALAYDATVEHLPLVSSEPTDPKVAGRARPDAPPRRLPDLREEIALMDQARMALRLRAPDRALATLEQYRTRFPRGSFGQEAMVSRIEALAASGNRTRAMAEATEFLTRHPNSPHAERLRLVMAGGTSAQH
jgi:hypothetical protein